MCKVCFLCSGLAVFFGLFSRSPSLRWGISHETHGCDDTPSSVPPSISQIYSSLRFGWDTIFPELLAPGSYILPGASCFPDSGFPVNSGFADCARWGLFSPVARLGPGGRRMPPVPKACREGRAIALYFLAFGFRFSTCSKQLVNSGSVGAIGFQGAGSSRDSRKKPDFVEYHKVPFGRLFSLPPLPLAMACLVPAAPHENPMPPPLPTRRVSGGVGARPG